jgi:hypothetical protein
MENKEIKKRLSELFKVNSDLYYRNSFDSEIDWNSLDIDKFMKNHEEVAKNFPCWINHRQEMESISELEKVHLSNIPQFIEREFANELFNIRKDLWIEVLVNELFYRIIKSMKYGSKN